MNTVAAEARRILQGRTWWILLLTGVAMAAVTVWALLGDHSAAVATGRGTAQAAADDATRYWMTIYLPCAWLGALVAASEFGTGEIRRSVLLNGGNRWRMMWTKLVAAVLVGALFGLVAASCGALLPRLLLPAVGIGVDGVTTDWQIVGGLFAMNVLAAAWGFAIGLIVRNAVVAIGFLAMQALLLETYAAKAFPAAGQYLFTSAMGSLYKDPVPASVSIPLALAIAGAWIVAAVAGGWLSLQRRDI